MVKRVSKILLLVSTASFIVYFVFVAVRGAIGFPERHARACIDTITEIADRAVNDQIPQGRYSGAIGGAEYIESHYPVGTVVPADHPFAEEYNKERRTQLSRVMAALKDATGVDYGRDWEKWRAYLDSSQVDRPADE